VEELIPITRHQYGAASAAVAASSGRVVSNGTKAQLELDAAQLSPPIHSFRMEVHTRTCTIPYFTTLACTLCMRLRQRRCLCWESAHVFVPVCVTVTWVAGLQVRAELTCPVCGTHRAHEEVFTSLSLPIRKATERGSSAFDGEYSPAPSSPPTPEEWSGCSKSVSVR
jgi:hypothetical protein